MSFEITVGDAPDPIAEEAILQGLVEFNADKTGLRGHKDLRIVVRDPGTGAVLGGLTGHSLYGWLFIKLLWLPESLRGTGVGTEIMGRAEEEARARGCIGIWLDTFSFQAKGFYERLGYRPFGRIDDFPPGHARHFLMKRLDGQG